MIREDHLFYESYGFTRDAWYEETRANKERGLPAPTLTPRRQIPMSPTVNLTPEMLLGYHANGMNTILDSAGIQGSPGHALGTRDLLAMAIQNSVGAFTVPNTPPNVSRVSTEVTMSQSSPAHMLAGAVLSLDTSPPNSEDDRLLESPDKKA